MIFGRKRRAEEKRVERACAAFWNNWSTVCKRREGLLPWVMHDRDDEACENLRRLMRIALEAADK